MLFETWVVLAAMLPISHWLVLLLILKAVCPFLPAFTEHIKWVICPESVNASIMLLTIKSAGAIVYASYMVHKILATWVTKSMT